MRFMPLIPRGGIAAFFRAADSADSAIALTDSGFHIRKTGALNEPVFISTNLSAMAQTHNGPF